MNKFVILILVCFLISACGVTPPRDYALQSKQVEKTVKMVPEWYTDLPVDDDMILVLELQLHQTYNSQLTSQH